MASGFTPPTDESSHPSNLYSLSSNSDSRVMERHSGPNTRRAGSRNRSDPYAPALVGTAGHDLARGQAIPSSSSQSSGTAIPTANRRAGRRNRPGGNRGVPHGSPPEPVRPAPGVPRGSPEPVRPEVVQQTINQAAMDVDVELTSTVNQYLQVNNITTVMQQGLDPSAVVEDCVRTVAAAYAAQSRAEVEAGQIRAIAMAVVNQLATEHQQLREEAQQALNAQQQQAQQQHQQLRNEAHQALNAQQQQQQQLRSEAHHAIASRDQQLNEERIRAEKLERALAAKEEEMARKDAELGRVMRQVAEIEANTAARRGAGASTDGASSRTPTPIGAKRMSMEEFQSSR